MSIDPQASPGSMATIPQKKLRLEVVEGGQVWCLTLASPRGNVLGTELTAELTQVFEAALQTSQLKAIVLSGDGPHFCFGASVEEHRSEQVLGMLTGFHALFRAIIRAGVPLVAAVRGVCLGGGLELAAFSQRIMAHPDSSYGQPEICLGVFAPVASAILVERVGRPGADDLLLTGRTLKAPEALALGLVDELSEEPEEAARGWVSEHLLSHSASSLRLATKAARLDFNQRFDANIRDLEKLYLGALMESLDATEGIAAFLDKRKPNWRNQ